MVQLSESEARYDRKLPSPMSVAGGEAIEFDKRKTSVGVVL